MNQEKTIIRPQHGFISVGYDGSFILRFEINKNISYSLTFTINLSKYGFIIETQFNTLWNAD